MRTCIKCSEEKTIEEFAIRRKGVYLNTCKDCSNRYKRERWQQNKEEHSARRKADHARNPEKYREQNRQRMDKDPEKWKQYARDWQKNKRDNDPKYRLHIRISKAIWKSIKKGSKGGETWLSFVDYELEDLISHLKKTIPKGYIWDDYIEGKLHLDHIIPISAHNFETPNDEDFKRAWSLDNLQLLTAFDNMSKGAKVDPGFQPALAM